MIIYILFLFILGIVIGSFLNVVSLRYSPETGFWVFEKINGLSTFDFRLSTIKWLGRSHCMSCGKTLSWYEFIPLIGFFYRKAGAGIVKDCFLGNIPWWNLSAV